MTTLARSTPRARKRFHVSPSKRAVRSAPSFSSALPSHRSRPGTRTLAPDIRAGGDHVGETTLSAARAAFDRILVEPTPADLWQLQKALVVVNGEAAARARAVARAFHACLRSLESKSASRRASRWGAVLGTAAVGSISVGEMADSQKDALQRLLQTGLPAMLEIGAAVKSAQAWEVEAGLIYDDLAWFLYDELWEVSATARPELSPSERRDQIDQLLDPLLDAVVPDGDRAALVVYVFRAVLAARLVPLFDLLSGDPPPVAGD